MHGVIGSVRTRECDDGGGLRWAIMVVMEVEGVERDGREGRRGRGRKDFMQLRQTKKKKRNAKKETMNSLSARKNITSPTMNNTLQKKVKQ